MINDNMYTNNTIFMIYNALIDSSYMFICYN